ncbi:hypothetical protein TGAM01_v204028 [Trichoderma gamsii]|uniref:Uncharacterized protein n=1 Tax=Trichoderma gamsii TaxID=398673 RepID=A0A2P4ZS31_9HYPO|nr:hypothetical protein TGAM01_v204028 [Trichoderma gamsii]PON27078.1 hypothetical protein TGAM01_v204028 [Trichoderma gamsii]
MSSSSSSNPIVLSPYTPSELLQYIVTHHRYPTTILIGWPKHTFIEALTEDVSLQLYLQAQAAADSNENTTKKIEEDYSSTKPPQIHPLQRKTLLQTAVSRHIRLLFVPSSTHLRAFLGTFSASDSKIPPPPPSSSSPNKNDSGPPMLIVYGLLEIHRDSVEWSAQGIGTTATYLIEAAARNSFRAAVVEPRGAMGFEALNEFLEEKLPVLSGTAMKSDEPWSGRTVAVRRVLARWFEFERQDKG